MGKLVSHKVKKDRIVVDPKKPLFDVPMDNSGKLANEYLDISQDIKDKQEELEHTGASLIEALRGSGRDSIKVRGVKLTVKSIEAKVKIAVKKDNGKK